MTFYLRPPEATVPVHFFQLYAESRLKFLIALIKSPPGIGVEELLRRNALEIPRLDAIIDGTPDDRFSHFALRSLAILDPNLIKYVQKWELELFRRRLWTCSTGKQVDSRLRQLLRHLRDFIPHLDTISANSTKSSHQLTLKGHAHFLETTFKVLLQVVKRGLPFCLDALTTTAAGGICPVHGNATVMLVPFTQVLPLLAELKVTILQGEAQIPCHQIPTYLELTFSKLLETSTDVMRGTECWDRVQSDPRLQSGSPALARIFQSHGYNFGRREISLGTAVAAGELINYDTLQNSIHRFPPCMSNMYRTLRQHHRLSHHARVQFTLFLKSIFVPVEVTLQLLQEEYSKVHTPGSSSLHKCEHSWTTDSRRYVYGTRHLYGLEGSRKNYSCHSCSEIQSSSPFTCSGCPFVESDSTLLGILSEDLGNESSAKEFMEGIVEGRKVEPSPIESCHEYLWFKVRQGRGRSCRQVKGSEAGRSEICENDRTKDRDNDDDDKEGEQQTKTILISKPTDFYGAIKRLI